VVSELKVKVNVAADATLNIETLHLTFPLQNFTHMTKQSLSF